MDMEIMLARVDERLKGLENKFDRLTETLEARKVSWWQAWGPILATAVALVGIYGTLAADVQKLHETDAASLQQRTDMDRRINRLEIAVIENAK